MSNENCSSFGNVAIQILPVMTIVGGIVNVVCFYIIFYHSPKNLGNYRSYLLVYQVFGTLCDVTFGALVIPVFILPVVAGAPFGLLRWLGVDTRFQLGVGFGVLMAMVSSVLMLFLYKQQQLISPQSSTKLSERQMLIFGVILTTVLFCSPLLFHAILFHLNEDNTPFMHRLLTIHPLFKCIIEDPFFYYYGTARLPFLVLLGVIIIFAVTFAFFCVRSSLNSLVNVKNRSAKTKAMQRKGVSVLIVQTLVPCVVVVIPIAGCCVCLWTLSVDLTGFGSWLSFGLATHGLVSTMCTLTVMKPYRRVLLSALGLKSSPKACHKHESTRHRI